MKLEGITQSSSGLCGLPWSGWGLDGQKDLRQGGNSCIWVLHCLSVSRAQLLPVESPEENVTSSHCPWQPQASFFPGSHLVGVQGSQSWAMRAPRLCVRSSLSQNRAENPCSALPVLWNALQEGDRSVPSLLPLTGPLLFSPHLQHQWEYPSHEPTCSSRLG